MYTKPINYGTHYTEYQGFSRFLVWLGRVPGSASSLILKFDARKIHPVGPTRLSGLQDQRRDAYARAYVRRGRPGDTPIEGVIFYGGVTLF